MIVVIMGVAGCGKTTVGQHLAAALGWPFFDGDDFHPAASLARMARGLALDDDDRRPWLARLRQLIDELCDAGTSAVIACSALRRRYREHLLAGCSETRLVYLEADRALLAQRLAARTGHFFPAALLESQLAALEAPGGAPEGAPGHASDGAPGHVSDGAPAREPGHAKGGAIVLDAGRPVADLVAAVIEALGDAARKPPGQPPA